MTQGNIFDQFVAENEVIFNNERLPNIRFLSNVFDIT